MGPYGPVVKRYSALAWVEPPAVGPGIRVRRLSVRCACFVGRTDFMGLYLVAIPANGESLECRAPSAFT